MHRIRFVRLFALFAFAALCPGLAFALAETFEGLLEPDGRDSPPIPIVVELRDMSTLLTGNVKTLLPLKAEAPIESGTNNYGRCTINVMLSKTIFLRLYGSCERAGYTGVYTMWDRQRKIRTEGSFRLTRRVPEPVQAETNPSSKTSPSSAAACLKANAQCLHGCPQGDQSAEFMCANHCRTKLRACRAQGKKTPLEGTD